MMKTPENYSEAVDYIEELPKFTKKHTLEHTKAFLKAKIVRAEAQFSDSDFPFRR